jgi:fucose permease
MSVPLYLLKVGFEKGMIIDSDNGFSAFIFVPAAYARTYEVFLFDCSPSEGTAVLQTAANLTLLCRTRKEQQRISIMGICNKGAGIRLIVCRNLKSYRRDLFKTLAKLRSRAECGIG